MAAMEALFRFQSKDIKDQILSNYSNGIKLDNGKGLDERIIYADEEAVQDEPELEEPEPVEEKEMWTQEQDDILIDNYEQFCSLPKKERYMVLAELVGAGKTYQDCYKRAKALKLKKANKEISKALSNKLIGANKQVT